jgi:hypothetical protein
VSAVITNPQAFTTLLTHRTRHAIPTQRLRHTHSCMIDGGRVPPLQPQLSTTQ